MLVSIFSLLNSLREACILSDIDFRQGSLKSQLRYCQKRGADYAVIVGEDELKDNSVVLRDMRQSSQKVVKMSELTGILSERQL